MAAGRRTAWQITARGRESWPSLKALLLSCSMRFSISNGTITQLITHTHTRQKSESGFLSKQHRIRMLQVQAEHLQSIATESHALHAPGLTVGGQDAVVCNRVSCLQTWLA